MDGYKLKFKVENSVTHLISYLGYVRTIPSFPADVLWGSFVTHSFSSLSVGYNLMLDKRTQKDVCGEATLYRVVFAPARKPYRITGLLFTHKNGDFSAISVTGRSCASPFSKPKSHISDRCSHYTR